MASLNHHPYLSEVLLSLQKHQMAVESRAHALATGGGGVGADSTNQLWTELPWRNEAQEWAALEAQRRRAQQETLSAVERQEREAEKDSLTAPASALYSEARSALASLEGTFAVDGRDPKIDLEQEAWEDDSPEMKQALRMAGEPVYDAPARSVPQATREEEPQDTEGNGRPITGPREPVKQHRACSMFSF